MIFSVIDAAYVFAKCIANNFVRDTMLFKKPINYNLT